MFILHKDERDDSVVDAFQEYQNYVDSKKSIFPKRAYELVKSDWYYNFGDHRCPHDAWLEEFSILEPSSGERSEIRANEIRVKLLGAYHDGYIEIRYPKVYSYKLLGIHSLGGHRDWRYDEFRVSDSGHLIHEIEWCGSEDTANWEIEADDIVFSWVPNDNV